MPSSTLMLLKQSNTRFNKINEINTKGQNIKKAIIIIYKIFFLESHVNKCSVLFKTIYIPPVNHCLWQQKKRNKKKKSGAAVFPLCTPYQEHAHVEGATVRSVP